MGQAHEGQSKPPFWLILSIPRVPRTTPILPKTFRVVLTTASNPAAVSNGSVISKFSVDSDTLFPIYLL